MTRWVGILLFVAACGRESTQGRAFPIPGERGARVTVEVLNASGRGGLARSGVEVLRRAGMDVVFFGNAERDLRGADSTRILVRRGSVDAGERVREALGVGRVVMAPDSTLLLDVSVLLGADFVPRPEFHP